MRHLDRIDRELIRLLQNDARLSNKELAASVGLAPSSCFGRVKRLRDDGVLTGFHASIDPAAAGVGLQALVTVRLAAYGSSNDAILAHLRTFDEVVAVFEVGGAADLVIHVAVRDADHLRELVYGGLQSREEVVRTETTIVFRHEWRRLPLLNA